MQVTSYQMHSMLECYSRKLSRTRRADEASPQRSRGEGALSPESSREATMDKISRQVLEKISDVVSLSRSREEAVPADAESHGAADAAGLVRPARGGTDHRTVAKTDSWV
jgi:hypothetical protein